MFGPLAIRPHGSKSHNSRHSTRIGAAADDDWFRLIPGDIPIDFYDERMSTMVAYRFLDETGTFGKKRKNAIDTLSAEIILQGYIDRERQMTK